MECKVKVKLKSAVRKVSSLENVYHELEVIETVIPDNSENEPIDRDWHKLYFPVDSIGEGKEELIGKEVEMTIRFYPHTRTVGDQKFDNIKCNVVALELIKGE